MTPRPAFAQVLFVTVAAEGACVVASLPTRLGGRSLSMQLIETVAVQRGRTRA